MTSLSDSPPPRRQIYVCPECKNNTLEWHRDGNRAYCHHCDVEVVEARAALAAPADERDPRESEGPCGKHLESSDFALMTACPDCNVTMSPEDWKAYDAMADVSGARGAVDDAAVERGARAAFWEDDLGGHVKGRWTWDTIPEEGRENYRKMVRAVLEAASRSALPTEDEGK